MFKKETQKAANESVKILIVRKKKGKQNYTTKKNKQTRKDFLLNICS